MVQSWFITQKTTEVIVQMNLPEFVVSNAKVEKTFDVTSYLSVVYGVGCIILGLKLIMNIFNLYRYLYGITPISKAFSFFNTIFIADGLDPDDVIYDHERVHARQFHSFDVLLFEIIGIFCWFNPVIYLYKTAIKNIHEFIADEIASQSLPSKIDYVMLLFSEKFQTHPSVLVNNFFTKTSLKMRIEMLNKKRSNKVAVLKYGLIFPLFLGMLIFASAFIANGENVAGLLEKMNDNVVSGVILNEENKPVVGASIIIKGAYRGTTTDLKGAFKINIKDSKTVLIVSHVGFESMEVPISDQNYYSVIMKKQIISLMETVVVAYSPNFFKDTIKTKSIVNEPVNGEIFSIVEQNAEFPGGQAELGKFLQRNLRYPKEAQRNNVQGKVFAKFIVEADGEISNISILKGLGSGLDEETVRVIGKMPNWNPGKQNGRAVNSEFAMPVSFVLEGVENSNSRPFEKTTGVDYDHADLFYINGKEVTKKIAMSINNTSIKAIGISKGDVAIRKFGQKGKNGVVEIVLKSDDEAFIDKNKFEKQPIYFLDGKEISLAKVKELDEAKIQSVNVVTVQDAITKYGEKGKDGVVEIITRTNSTDWNDLAKISQLQEEVFTVVEENAEFPGGQGGMGEFLAKNLRYPNPALRANVQGKVFLSFIVKKNGDIQDIQILKGLGFGLDEEAIRVIKAMPKWKPAKQSG
ncbi:MAG: M56 family metallopeptidase, partial [Bacteroidota bacterium]